MDILLAGTLFSSWNGVSLPGNCPAPLRPTEIRLWKTFRSKLNAIPVAEQDCSPSHRNHVHLPTGMLFGITTEWRSASDRNRVHLRPYSSPAHLQKILDIELGMVQQRILMAPGTRKFAFYCTQSVKDLLVEEGTNAEYGARHLKRAVEKNLVFPLANLVASAQVRMGDFLRVDRSPDGQMVFVKEAEGATESILMRSGGWAAGLSSLAAQSAANHINTTASSLADMR